MYYLVYLFNMTRGQVDPVLPGALPVRPPEKMWNPPATACIRALFELGPFQDEYFNLLYGDFALVSFVSARIKNR